MSYDELSAAYERLRGPVVELGDVYQRTGEQLSAAARVEADGTVSVNDAVLRATIEAMAPPETSGQYELLTEGLELGFLVQGGQPIAPWAAFTRPEVYSQFDAGLWRSVGFLPSEVETGEGRLVRDRAAPFAGVSEVPDAVLAPENMAQLYAAAAQPAQSQGLLLASASRGLKSPAWAKNPDMLTRLALRDVGVDVKPPADAGTSSQPLTVADVPIDKLKALSECLKGSRSAGTTRSCCASASGRSAPTRCETSCRRKTTNCGPDSRR